jgi:hypothetical protein
LPHLSRDSKAFRQENLSIFIDSDSLEPELSQSNGYVKTLLLFNFSNLFKFIRTPYNTKNTELETIPTFEMEFDGRNIKALVIKNPSIKETTHLLFGHNEEEIEHIAERIFNTDSLNEYYKESIRSVLMCAELFRENGQKQNPLFVTRNESLLETRLNFKAYMTPIPYILTVEEAMERMDLFAKSHGK